MRKKPFPVVLFILCSPAILLSAVLARDRTELNGKWVAAFADSLGWGEVDLKLKETDKGEISGSYETSMGGKGKLRGNVVGSQLQFKMDQKNKNCPGAFNAVGTIHEGRIEGTYEGLDCLGFHQNGRFSLLRANAKGKLNLRVLRPRLRSSQHLSSWKSRQGPVPAVKHVGSQTEVEASVAALPNLVIADLWVVNNGDSPFAVEQSKIFLLEGEGKEVHRYADYELRLNILRTAGAKNLPDFNPPPPRRYYAATGSSFGQYSLMEIGTGYYGIGGFTTSYTITSAYDYSPGLGYALAYGIFTMVEKIKEKIRMSRAEKLVKQMEEAYFKDRLLERRGEETGGVLIFDAPRRFPVTLVVFVGDEHLSIEFDRQ